MADSNSSGGGVGASLKRKVGPLPVWGWAILAGVILYYVRNRGAGSATAAVAQQQASTTDQQPQSPVVLAPGETVYDPNTGYLSGGSGGGGNNINNGILSIIGAIMASQFDRNRGKKHHTRPPRKHHHKHHKSHVDNDHPHFRRHDGHRQKWIPGRTGSSKTGQPGRKGHWQNVPRHHHSHTGGKKS